VITFARHVEERGRFRRTYDGKRIRYYYRGIRVPWILWVMFS
jgi:hypothetical protein